MDKTSTPPHNLLLPRVPPRQAPLPITSQGGRWRLGEEQPVRSHAAVTPTAPDSQAPGGTAAPPPAPSSAQPAPRPRQARRHSGSSRPSPGASITGRGGRGASPGATCGPLPSLSAPPWPRASLGNRGVPSSLSSRAWGPGEAGDGADAQAARWAGALRDPKPWDRPGQEEGSAGCSPAPGRKEGPCFRRRRPRPTATQAGRRLLSHGRPGPHSLPQRALSGGRGPGVEVPASEGSEEPAGTGPSLTRPVAAAGTTLRSLPQAGWAWTLEEAPSKALTQPGPLPALP